MTIEPGEYWMAVADNKFKLTPFTGRPSAIVVTPGQPSRTKVYRVTVNEICSTKKQLEKGRNNAS